jgi:hypothetical protein
VAVYAVALFLIKGLLQYVKALRSKKKEKRKNYAGSESHSPH